MLKFKFILVFLVSPFLGNISFSQSNPYEIVVSGGTGVSLSNITLKTGTNLGLKEAGLDSRVQTTLMVNGMLDVCVVKNVSVGLAYSHKQFYWTDAFQDTIEGVPTQAMATLSIQKRNYGLRCLYHFGKSENFEVYTGLRLGVTHWIIDVSGQANAESLTDMPVSEFSLPATYPSIQAIGGFRHYFGRVFGWFGEVGVGTSPYFCSIGLNLRLNPNK
jgi:hypothetical protein